MTNSKLLAAAVAVEEHNAGRLTIDLKARPALQEVDYTRVLTEYMRGVRKATKLSYRLCADNLSAAEYALLDGIEMSLDFEEDDNVGC